MKTWFITGASSGFGWALAEEALRRGDRVVATARDPKTLAGLGATALQLDVTKPDDIARAVAAAGPIDVLVNNAGYSIIGALEETSDAEVRAAFEPMFFGPVALMRAVIPQLRERRAGTIVNITSVGGITTAPGFGTYCAVKHALEAMSESLAAELAPFGVNVLVVEPGAFRTKLFGGAFKAMPAQPAYETTVAPVRAWVESQAGKQPGDPVLAAKAIVDAVANPEGLRLPLGGDAVDNIRGKLAQIAADVDRTEAAARATGY